MQDFQQTNLSILVLSMSCPGPSFPPVRDNLSERCRGFELTDKIILFLCFLCKMKMYSNGCGENLNGAQLAFSFQTARWQRRELASVSNFPLHHGNLIQKFTAYWFMNYR